MSNRSLLNPCLIVVYSILFYISIQNIAYAQLVYQETGQGFSLQNRSAATLINLKRGGSHIDALNSGSTWQDDNQVQVDLLGQSLPLKLSGRIDLDTWGDSLKQLNNDPVWAEFHLRTAGVHLSHHGKMFALLGAPLLAQHIIDLRQVPDEISATWAQGSTLQQGLVASAARYVSPGSLLKSLMKQTKPTDSFNAWPKAYQILPPLTTSIRQAIEAHGVKALPLLVTHEEWAKDRGFFEVQLAFALGDEEVLLNALHKVDPQVSKRIKARFKEEQRLCDEYGVNASEGMLRSLIETREAGDIDGSLSIAVRVALMWRRHNMTPEEGQATQMVCGHLDWGAQKAINEKQTLAAQAYLTLGQSLCHGVSYFRSRAAEFMRTKGDQSYFASDFEGAQHWYRAALWLSDEIIDRVRLIDTLSQLSLMYLVQGELMTARLMLKEARLLETSQVPTRESLMLAYELMPQPDYKLRLGLILIIFVVGIAVVLQLAKIIFARKA
jgi:hypothetical protein